MDVYKAINKVQAALSSTGIAKDRRNTQGSGYNFRGIDDVYNAIAPLLAEHGLVIVPRFIARSCDERQSKNGGALFYVTVEAEFDFVSASDGSKHTARTFGEAMDSGDKATNKAMSAAYKYAAFQTFAIPTEAHPDADSETHQVASREAMRREWLEARKSEFRAARSGTELRKLREDAESRCEPGDEDAVNELRDCALEIIAEAKKKASNEPPPATQS